jgi:hypothetical protein
MKTKLFGLIAAVAFCSPWPAMASQYFYDVNFDINSTLVSGTITTTCDSCDLTASNVSSWSFSANGGLSISSTEPSAFVSTFAYATSPLFAQPSQLHYDSTAPGDIYFAGDGGLNTFLFFDNTGATPEIGYRAPVNNEQPVPSTDFRSISSTPIPAALPLFVTGLGGLGLLGWRRKRKNAAAVAA